MSNEMTRSSQVTCTGFQGKPLFLRCIVAFLLTAVVVYSLGRVSSSSPVAGPASARAQIDLPLIGELSGDDDKSIAAAADDIKRSILTDATLSQALTRLAATDAPAVEAPANHASAVARLREHLQVSVERTSIPGRLAVSLVCTDAASPRAAGIARAIAEQLAEKHQTRSEAATTQRISESRSASDKARGEFGEAGKRVAQFLETHFREEQVPSEPSDAASIPSDSAAEARSVSSPGVVTQPRRIDNPEWVEVESQLREAEQRLESLRADRTPDHPEVREFALRVADLTRRLATLPRQILNNTEVVALPGNDGAQPPPQDAAKPKRPPGNKEYAEVVRAYRDQRVSLDRAASAVDRTLLKERAACDRRISTGNLTVWVSEQASEVPPPGPPPHLMWMAFASAVTVAVGVAMISTGMAVDPPLRTSDEAKAKLPIPVVATIRTGRNRAGAAAGRSKAWERIAWLALGTALIVACGGLLYYAR